MYEYKTPEQIMETLLADIDDSIDKREGSVVYDLLYPSAIEFSLAYEELDAVLMLGFAETTQGEYLDLRAGELGLTRKGSVKAQGYVTLSASTNVTVPTGTRLQTQDDIYFVTLEDAVLTNGTATVLAEAELGGTSGNVAPNTINSLASGNFYGVVSVTNNQSFNGGEDNETDEALLQRVRNRVQKPVTSGNANHYEQWALEVAGVGFAKVYPVWNGGGTVKVVLLDDEKNPPNQNVVDATTSHIEANKPIGATVTVVPAIETPINISATLTLANGATLDDATTEITELISNYLKSLAFVDPTVRYAKIASLMFETDSIIDYTNLTVNGGSTNIVIEDGNIASIGTVSFG